MISTILVATVSLMIIVAIVLFHEEFMAYLDHIYPNQVRQTQEWNVEEMDWLRLQRKWAIQDRDFINQQRRKAIYKDEQDEIYQNSMMKYYDTKRRHLESIM